MHSKKTVSWYGVDVAVTTMENSNILYLIYRVFQKKWQKVCMAISYELFVLEL